MSKIITRRGLIAGLAAVLAAPAIVRAASLMPVRASGLAEVPLPDGWLHADWSTGKVYRVWYQVVAPNKDGDFVWREIPPEKLYVPVHVEI